MSDEDITLEELLEMAKEEPSRALTQQLILVAVDYGKRKQRLNQDAELRQFKNPKNWTRSYDHKGDLLREHALYLPYLKDNGTH